MKGLIIKDLSIMAQRNKFFVLMFGCVVFMNFYADSSFASMWSVLLGAIFVISTFAYDEYDNCYPFLMTLPADRKEYAYEKYLLGAIITGGCFIICLLISALCCAVKGTSFAEFTASVSLSYILMPVLMLDICIPVNIKYGSERGRLVLFLIFAVLGCVAVFIDRVAPDLLLPVGDSAFTTQGGISAFLIIAAGVLTALSLAVSGSIMEKKEF